jgi:hypothetical protein
VRVDLDVQLVRCVCVTSRSLESYMTAGLVFGAGQVRSPGAPPPVLRGSPHAPLQVTPERADVGFLQIKVAGAGSASPTEGSFPRSFARPSPTAKSPTKPLMAPRFPFSPSMPGPSFGEQLSISSFVHTVPLVPHVPSPEPELPAPRPVARLRDRGMVKRRTAQVCWREGHFWSLRSNLVVLIMDGFRHAG